MEANKGDVDLPRTDESCIVTALSMVLPPLHIRARPGAIAPALPDSVLVGGLPGAVRTGLGAPGAAAVQHLEDPTGGRMHVRSRWTAIRPASRNVGADASHASSISSPGFTDYAVRDPTACAVGVHGAPCTPTLTSLSPAKSAPLP